MQADPKKNRTTVDHILLEQFRRKGYNCEQVQEKNSTIFIITHEKKSTDLVRKAVNETYKTFIKSN